MSNYTMNVTEELTKNEYGNIHDYLGVIDINDNFNMEIEDSSLINFHILNKIFEENNLVKTQQKICENGRCIIKASKME